MNKCRWMGHVDLLLGDNPSMAFASKKTTAKVAAFLQNGGNLWISIEGRRSKNGSLSQFKKGPVVTAIRTQAKLVPVSICGTIVVLGYDKYIIRSGRVVVRLLEAIHTKGMNYEDRDVVVSQLFALAEREVPKIQ